jgi:amidohydrolase
MSLKTRIQKLAGKYADDVIQIRRHIHAHPELSFEEFETSKFVAEKLRSYGMDPTEGIAGTGLSVTITGQNPDSAIIALRADMDALPIQELNEVPYKSKKEGIMHACGHDVHTASLLGTARILNEIRDELNGSVRLIFQPGEERFPGGASLMIREGILKDPEPKGIFGQHVMPFIDVGKVGFREGMYMASADEIYFTVKGKGGHAATPELNIDPVVICSQIIIALQQIVSRHASPKLPSVVSFGKVNANGATNVIPDEVQVEGTFRTLNEEWRMKAHRIMKDMAEGMAKSMGGSCDFEIKKGYPYLENNPELTRNARQYAVEYLGEENVIDMDIWMAGEDFSFYTHHVPGCFYRLGTRNEEKGIVSSVHTPTFDIDESALQTGIGLMSWIAVRELEGS